MSDKTETFRAMVARQPENPLARFGLANELLKVGAWQEAAEQLEAYLARYDDEGTGWGRLAEARHALGDRAGAVEALGRGVEASHRFGHTGMAQELETRREELELEG